VSKSRGRRRGHRGHREKRKPVQVPAAKTRNWQSNQAASIAGYTSKKWSTRVWSCDHWQQPFDLNDGLKVLASGWMDRPFSTDTMRKPTITADVGVYLDNSWALDRYFITPNVDLDFEEDQETVILPWDDYSTPESMRRFETTLKWMMGKLRGGATVEVGCLASHGRTGTVLACLLVMQGLEPEAAIRRVRSSHCTKAVENHGQREWVRRFSAHIRGETFVPIQLRRVTQPAQTAERMIGQDAESIARAVMFPERDDSKVQDDEDYRMWLRLNAYPESLVDELTEDEKRYIDGDLGSEGRQADDVCVMPPCLDQNACHWEAGECFRKTVLLGDDDYERWDI
jgi:hypothetical protein